MKGTVKEERRGERETQRGGMERGMKNGEEGDGVRGC